MTASRARGFSMYVFAVISDTLALNEAAFAAPDRQLIQWWKVSASGLQLATLKSGGRTDWRFDTGL
ncbi:MAG: hypothetical protein O2960_00970 [Verrucomicrobia bacterium]|nr:hypothetical protein [Verrucomicrobiota bacterium]